MTNRTTHIDWDILNEYEDGLLAPPAAARVTQHLAMCNDCRAQHDTLRATVSMLRAAPMAAAPATLWNDVHASIAPATSTSTAPTPAPQTPTQHARRAFTFTGPALAAAALLLIVLSVSGTLLIDRRAGGAALPSLSMDSAGTTSTPLPLTAVDVQFVASVETLERQLAAQRDSLRPQTIAILERSLRTIDDALLEARTALLADPANAALRNALETTYQQKLDFLTRATQIASAD